MSPDTLFWMAVGGLLMTGVAALGARSLAGFSPHELTELQSRGKAPGRLVQILKHREHLTLACETLQVIATTVFVGATVYWGWAESPGAGGVGGALVGSTLALAAVGLLAAEIWLSRAVARLWAAGILYYTWDVWRLVGILLAPVVMAARFVDALLHRLAGRPREVPDEDSFEEEIRTIVTEGHREGLLEEDAREMIEGVIELGDADVSEIMTPRTDMVSIPKSLSWEDALRFVIQCGHTRIPVTDKNRDDVIGILVTKDLLPELAKGPDEPKQPWTSLLREPYFVPETKPIDVLLQEFQQTRNHLAVVLDEYGGVSGLVTLEDVVEEIVGEIVDEYDKELVEDIRMGEDGVCEALGKAHIDEINEQLGLELPEDGDFDTIGGLVFSELGHVPVEGEELVRPDVRITVVEATPRRIERVRIEVLERNGRNHADEG